MSGATDYARLTTANDTVSLSAAGGAARLWSIVVGTKAASAVVTVYNATAATTGKEMSVIDAATGPITHHFYGASCRAGLFVKLTGGNADVTVNYS